MACQFCLTGRLGLSANLSAAQIVEQLVAARRLQAREGAAAPITNIVFMGELSAGVEIWSTFSVSWFGSGKSRSGLQVYIRPRTAAANRRRQPPINAASRNGNQRHGRAPPQPRRRRHGRRDDEPPAGPPRLTQQGENVCLCVFV
jgi:hypothetical protein